MPTTSIPVLRFKLDTSQDTSTALFFKQIQQLQRLSVAPGFEQLAHVIDVAMDQKKIVWPRPGTSGALFLKIFPERRTPPRNIQMMIDETHNAPRIAVAVNVLEADVSIRFLAVAVMRHGEPFTKRRGYSA